MAYNMEMQVVMTDLRKKVHNFVMNLMQGLKLPCDKEFNDIDMKRLCSVLGRIKERLKEAELNNLFETDNMSDLVEYICCILLKQTVSCFEEFTRTLVDSPRFQMSDFKDFRFLNSNGSEIHLEDSLSEGIQMRFNAKTYGDLFILIVNEKFGQFIS